MTFTAAATSPAGTPTGTVTFASDGNPLGIVGLTGGQAALTTSALVTGNHTIAATYTPDPNFLTSATTLAFSVDRLTVATRDDSALPNGDYIISTDPAQANNELNLVAIYNCKIDPAGDTIRPVLPQIGSGTRQFFLDKLGVARTDQPTFEATHPCINVGFLNRQGPVENHGNQLNDPRDIVPYSTAAYLSQLNRGIDDTHGRAVLGRIDAIRPAIPNPAAGPVGITIRTDSGLPTRSPATTPRMPIVSPRSTTVPSRSPTSGRCCRRPALSGRHSSTGSA